MANIISATIETPIQVTERLRENFIWLPRYEELRVSVDGFLEQTLELRRRSESAMSKRVGEGRALVVVGESGLYLLRRNPGAEQTSKSRASVASTRDGGQVIKLMQHPVLGQGPQQTYAKRGAAYATTGERQA